LLAIIVKQVLKLYKLKKILSINNLTKKFGKITAVDNLSFDIEKGKIYGILGPNGSGKSTTLGIVLNVVNPTSGEFSWFEEGLSHHEALKKVGAIIERPNFYPYMTAEQNLKLVCKIKESDPDRIPEILEMVNLLERKDSKFSTFSGNGDRPEKGRTPCKDNKSKVALGDSGQLKFGIKLNKLPKGKKANVFRLTSGTTNNSKYGD